MPSFFTRLRSVFGCQARISAAPNTRSSVWRRFVDGVRNSRADDQIYFSASNSSVFLRIKSSPFASFQLSSPYHQ